jgi:hypothetical protein
VSTRAATSCRIAPPRSLSLNDGGGVRGIVAETSWGATRSARGKRLDSEGRCVLVGVARLPPSSDPITSTLLMLPTDALAVLQVKFEFIAK